MKKDLIPTRYTNFVKLERNFLEKYRGYAETLGVEKSEVDKTINILSEHIKSHSEMISKKAESKAATETHIANNRNAVKEFRRVSKMIRSLRGYSPEMGENLGIVATQSAEKDYSELQPTLNVKAIDFIVNIKFKKQRMDGIKIYTKRGDEKDFTFLDYCATSPYKDDREKLVESIPENREYYATYVMKFKEVGFTSSITKVVVP
ncbi:MAG: hypothetical protein IPL53_00475 [Ignavibacteria bacterium]|nr:hypothetical protein [Ignavibacteria bacterium]